MVADIAPRAATRIARQPILDRRDRVGYELLYRGGATDEDDDSAKTARAVVASVLEFGLDHLVGGSRAYFNVGTRFLVDGHHLSLPPSRVVLELLEHEPPTPRLREILRDARELGYRVALDDFVLESPQRELLDEVDLVKVDLTVPGAYEVMATLAADGRCVLAEKVEDRDEHRRAVDSGATLFQGFYFARPLLEEMAAASPSALLGLRSLAQLADPDLPFERAVELVAADPALASRMLVATNASFHGIARRIESVHEAVVFLGAERVRRIALVCVLDGLREGGPRELLRIALARAELCRAIVGEHDPALGESAYTCGLLSVLDALTGVPMTEELLSRCGLDERLVAGIVHRRGVLGGAVTAAISVIADPEESMAPGMNPLYQRAIRQADALIDSLDRP